MDTQYNVPSLEACAEICFEEASYCSGYTWHGDNGKENEFYSFVCTTFQNPGVMVTCTNCHSVDLTDKLVAGECEPTYATGREANVSTLEACHKSCRDSDNGCSYWT